MSLPVCHSVILWHIPWPEQLCDAFARELRKLSASVGTEEIVEDQGSLKGKHPPLQKTWPVWILR